MLLQGLLCRLIPISFHASSLKASDLLSMAAQADHDGPIGGRKAVGMLLQRVLSEEDPAIHAGVGYNWWAMTEPHDAQGCMAAPMRRI